ncbi:TetR/AcrR family transcriptional regulator [Streptomyces sp. 2MCAF27]
MRRSAAETREHVLAVAHDLFYWHGVRAVGIDRVAREAGVAPTTLYRLFASKDDLVAAYVEHNGHGYQQWFTEATRADGRHPRERILALFDALISQVQPDQCRGCPFLMTLAEFPDRELPAHRNAVAVKRWVRDRFRELTDALATVSPIADPPALADQLTVTLEGVYASVQAHRADWPAQQARAMAELLLDAHRT